MAKYYYCPFPKHSDDKLTGVRKAYLKQSNDLETCFDPVAGKLIANRAPALGKVQPGDLIYLNAHGLESAKDTIEAGHTVKSKKIFSFSTKVVCRMTAAELALQMVKYDGLGDGVNGHPIYIKCLICYAGGPDLNDQTEQQLSNVNQKTGVIALGRDHFANLLASQLKVQGKSYIMTGGYPGEIKARPKGVKTLWTTRETIQPEPQFTKLSGTHSMAWFDTNGKLYYKSAKDTLTQI